MKIVKFMKLGDNKPTFGIPDQEGIIPIRGISGIGELFSVLNADEFNRGEKIPFNKTALLPPVDETSAVYCAGLNYTDHAKEMDMALPETPIFFSKAITSVAGGCDDIIYPETTQLLDYEIELALIAGKRISFSDIITPENISEYILGITIMNDITARDQQLRAGQWFMGKNNRTFAPLGPEVQLLDKKTVNEMQSLTLDLQVYNSGMHPYENKKQMGNTADMIFKPFELINVLTRKFDLRPGDVISTGTPCNVALSKPDRFKSRLAEIFGIPPQKRIEKFINDEIKNNKKYLAVGDVIISRIYNQDRTISLGEQRNRIVIPN